MRLILFMVGLMVLGSCHVSKLQDYFVLIRSQTGGADFSSAVGGSDGVRFDLCGINGFSGKASVSLENAPAGVSLSLPSNALLDVLEICPAYAASDLIVEPDKNLVLSVSENASLGNALPFTIVLKTQHVTKRIPATFTIFTIAAQQ